jgi:uncharacterized protein (DUF362 family)
MVDLAESPPQGSRVRTTGDLEGDLARAIEAIGGWEWPRGDQRVLVKPNYNSAHPPPGSTASDLLRAALLLLREHGARNLTVGESTSLLNHRQVLEQAGALQVAEELHVPVVILGEDGWDDVTIGGKYLRRARLARTLRHVDRIVYLCCPKTHHAAQFTGSLKLGMGFADNWRRTLWHLRHLQEKIAELNLALSPDLILADMRRTFISGGPAAGELCEPGLVLASHNRVAIDVEAIRIIQGYPGHSLPADVAQVRQIARAIELGLGPEEGLSFRTVEL